jgi:hypothetical protein
MSDVLQVRRSNPVVNWATAIGVVCLAAAGFVLSFSSLRDLAIASGVPVGLAFLWPLIVDGFIVVAMLAAYTLKSRRPSATWYPWVAVGLFSAISVVGNAMHAAGNPQSLTVSVPVATIVNAVPAVALLIASHLLVVMVSERDPKSRRTKKAQRSAIERLSEESADTVAQRTPTHSLRAVEPASSVEGLAAALSQLRTAGEVVTAPLIARLEGVSERTGRRRLAELRVSHGYLFDSDPAAIDQEVPA